MDFTIDGDRHAGLNPREHPGMHRINLAQCRPDGGCIDLEASLSTREGEQALIDRTHDGHDRYSASSTRMGVSGSERMGWPVTWLTAQAIAARGGTIGASPTPFAPYG